jgi:hypothetical protein
MVSRAKHSQKSNQLDSNIIINDVSSIDEELSESNNSLHNWESSLQLLDEEGVDKTLYHQYKDHVRSRNGEFLDKEKEYKAGVNLLKLLQDAKAPLYVFDSIIDWVIDSLYDGVNFLSSSLTLKRNKMISIIESRFCFHGLRPLTKNIYLPGHKKFEAVTIHDFQQCLFSLLTDKTLMRFENLLFDERFNIMKEDDYQQSNELMDINTGSCFKDGFNLYIKDSKNEMFCPIIFFIDKTHTDTNARLCLEPVQFTLGIFNSKIRNSAHSWRTLGYIPDMLVNEKLATSEKLQDYHIMIGVILESFKLSQQKEIIWEFNIEGKCRTMILKIPVLFVIGDTEGHDKLCGKYLSRNKTTKCLCRYCDVPFEQTDDPFYNGSYWKHNQIVRLCQAKDLDSLKNMSMHCIENTWNDVLFCDPNRGINGATLAETLHCIQQGIFEYVISCLFNLKKERKSGKKLNTTASINEIVTINNVINTESPQKKKKIEDTHVDSNDDEEEEEMYYDPTTKEYSSFRVFSKEYLVTFESLCQYYGKVLQHQSDRGIPRTYFYSKYNSVAKKNGHEMAGILIVFLIVFSSIEGTLVLDKEMGEERCSAFIHVFELLLMLELFCKTESHKKSDIRFMKKSFPTLLNTMKKQLIVKKEME